MHIFSEFQSTLLHKERRRKCRITLSGLEISIHALTQRATEFLPSQIEWYYYFNPRSYTKSDFQVFDLHTLRSDFNPRSYTKSDTILAHYVIHDSHFNPRSYTKSDNRSLHISNTSDRTISIHALTQRATEGDAELF